MADPCRIKSGEIVDIDDPRLLSADCVIEPGAIIRPGSDTGLDDTGKVHMTKVESPPHPKKKLETPASAIVQVVSPVADVIVAPTTAPTQVKSVEISKPMTIQQQEVIPPVTDDHTLNGPMVVTAAVVAIASAVAVSGMGGIGAIQGKIASLGGNKAALAAGSGVAIGTVIAVKEMERRMSLIERDLAKSKQELDTAAKSIDRIDELLSRLG